MDHRQSLFKANFAMLGQKVCKRKTANDIRSGKRSDLYSSTRNISLSPSPRKNTNCPEEEQKENFKPPNPVAPLKPQENQIDAKECELPAPEVNKNPLSAKANEKQSRQKAHLLRYFAWKTEKAKQAELKVQASKRPPFVVPCRSAAEPGTILKKSFAPKGHSFQPPANIQIVDSNSIRCTNDSQKVTYHFLATPKKKNPMESKIATTKTAPAPKPIFLKPVVPKTSVVSTKVAVKPTETKTSATSLKTPITTTKSSIPPSKTKVPTLALDPKARIPIVNNKKTTPAIRKQTPSATTLKSIPKPTPNPSKTPIRPPLPPVHQSRKPIQVKSALEKPKSIAPSQRVLKLAGKSKNLSVAKGTKKIGAPSKIKLNGNYIKQSICSGLVKTSNPVPETPTDTNPETPFINIVTSTKRKSFSSKDSGANSLFLEMEKVISPFEDLAPTPDEQNSKSDKKFNFLRYSLIQSEDKPPEEKPKTPVEDVQVTPDRAAGPSPPTTYLSPYVSVSRGKVNVKEEKEKRNSIYMPTIQATNNHETTTTVRKTLATVHYYRKQLDDEIDRLNKQCDVWEHYKEANAQLIEDSGIDMINVTIGQTRLLTTKKLRQFGDLIDRCENGVLGKNLSYVDGGDGAKPILAEDLEGFWSMVGLQIENVDKRFANLQRWKDNNWKDPDELPSKSTNPGVVVKKTKKRKGTNTAGPNIALQKMLRNAHAAYLRKKVDTGGVDEDVILTPSKSRQVLIRDRRSRSAAPTIITVNTPRVNRKSPAFEQTTPTSIFQEPKLLPHINGFRKSLNRFKSNHLNGQDKSSSPSDYNSPLAASSRKSILKTPGSKCRPKSVIFNSPTIKFTIEDAVDEPVKHKGRTTLEEEEEEEQRTYSLRNRNIVLRDSAEIIIPK